jgi:cysteinyl-tRNA synthetase
MLNLFNTETRQKEPVHARDGKVSMYACGPTIYDFAHIGNFRTYVFEDLLRRTLQYFGMEVEEVMNITDIDDKTIGGAIRKKVPLKTYTEPFRIAFFEDLETLSIQPVEHTPAATDYIPEMIGLIETLLEKGYAYKAKSGSVYYKISQFSTYGRLSHLSLDELMVNASGENESDEYEKDQISDFVLWKAYDPSRDGEIFWESPFGRGRPGWHIECSAMAMKLLGETIDIHCGGVDNMFPHHENEIAQSEGCTGHRFVRHWVHVEHLLVDRKKMSKKLGNFYTLRDLMKKGYTGDEIRYLLLSTHYKTQLNFTFHGLDAARASLQRIGDLISRLKAIESGQRSGFAAAPLEKAELRFRSALSDDLNISIALASLFDLVRELNGLLDENKIGREEAALILKQFEKWDEVLAVLPLQPKGDVPEELLEMLAKREEARKTRDFRVSDQMRDAIYAHGYLIEDTPTGARLKKR